MIGGSGIDQGGVGGPGTPPSGRAGLKDHFNVPYVYVVYKDKAWSNNM